MFVRFNGGAPAGSNASRADGESGIQGRASVFGIGGAGGTVTLDGRPADSWCSGGGGAGRDAVNGGRGADGVLTLVPLVSAEHLQAQERELEARLLARIERIEDLLSLLGAGLRPGLP